MCSSGTDKHKHICKRATPKANKDAMVRDCDEVKLFDGTAVRLSNVDVDDDITVDVEGENRVPRLRRFANSHPPISTGTDQLRRVHPDRRDQRPVRRANRARSPDVECTSASGRGPRSLIATGVPPAASEDPGFVFYDETYDMPSINLR